MKIVFLDAKTIGDDIDLSGFDSLGEVTKYNFTTPEEAPERVKDADVLIINKVPINENTVGTAKNLKLVCVTATGTNNLDKDYLDSHKIAWRNVAGYSTETVTQHTFAMLFYLLEKLRYYDDYVKDGNYINDTSLLTLQNIFQRSMARRGESSDLARSDAALPKLPGHLVQMSSIIQPPDALHRMDIRRLISIPCLPLRILSLSMHH